MSKARDMLQEKFDGWIRTIAEWKSPHGEMGIYQTEQGFTYLFIHTDTMKYMHPYIRQMPIELVMEDARCIAQFAGLESEPDETA